MVQFEHGSTSNLFFRYLDSGPTSLGGGGGGGGQCNGGGGGGGGQLPLQLLRNYGFLNINLLTLAQHKATKG